MNRLVIGIMTALTIGVLAARFAVAEERPKMGTKDFLAWFRISRFWVTDLAGTTAVVFVVSLVVILVDRFILVVVLVEVDWSLFTLYPRTNSHFILDYDKG